MRKELLVYVATNEPDTEVKVQRVADDPKFMLLTIGTVRVAVDAAELIEAFVAIEQASKMFDMENLAKAARAAAPKRNVEPEDEGAVILESHRLGPSPSELALEKEMRLMQGDTIEIKE